MTREQVLSIAAGFHCEVVRLADGTRLQLRGETPVAHYARGVRPAAIRNPYEDVR